VTGQTAAESLKEQTQFGVKWLGMRRVAGAVGTGGWRVGLLEVDASGCAAERNRFAVAGRVAIERMLGLVAWVAGPCAEQSQFRGSVKHVNGIAEGWVAAGKIEILPRLELKTKMKGT